MSEERLPFVDVNPQRPHDAVVIWLHGLGDSGNGFAPIVPQLGLPDELAIRFVFPHAPVIPVTINNGMAMRAWYDIKNLSFEDRADMEGVMRSAGQVRLLIEEEIAKGTPAERIVLAGFSQGGVIAYYLGLRFEQKLAGIMTLSTYMCDADTQKLDWHEANKATPIFASHGVYDEMVPIALGKAASQNLSDAGYQVQWQQYPIQHNVCMEQLQEVASWLTARLGK
ncbi:MAG: alpha/beta hydrolase [Aestuariibacter sp.]